MKNTKEICVMVVDEDGNGCGKSADLEGLSAFFDMTGKISLGWNNIDESLDNKSKTFNLEICERKNGKLTTLKSIPLKMDMFRSKSRFKFW